MSRGVGPGGGFGSDNQVTRRIAEMERERNGFGSRVDALEALTNSGSIASTGSVSLTTGAATSTVKTDAKVTSTCLIFLFPTNAGAFSLDNGVSAITAGSGSFTITHLASALARSFNYIAFNP